MSTAPGSGVTLYVEWNEYLNASITLDGNLDPTLRKADGPLPPDSTGAYNFSLYDVQSLPFGNHEVTVSVLDFSPSQKGAISFDYAAVNDAPAGTRDKHSQ
jgi:hypothetical protein